MLVNAAEIGGLATCQGGLQPVPLRGECLARPPMRDDYQARSIARNAMRRWARIYSKQHPRATYWPRTIPTRRVARNATVRTAFWAKRTRNRATFPTNVPGLCSKCHSEGKKAALRYTGTQHDIIHELHGEHSRQGPVEERIDGDGDLHQLPHRARHSARQGPGLDGQSARICPKTCGKCHQRH